MSALREAVNARAYARAGRSLRVCHCDACDAPSDPPCAVCGADDVPLDDEMRCEMCRPAEEEE